MKIKFPEWVQAEGVLKRDDAVGWNNLYPGDVVTLNPGDYMKVGDAVLNVHRDGTISLYPDSQARAHKPGKDEPVPDGVERDTARAAG